MSADDPSTDPRELARRMAEEAKARTIAKKLAEDAKVRAAAAAATPAPAPAAPPPARPSPAPAPRPRRNLTPEEAMKLALEEEQRRRDAPPPPPKPAPTAPAPAPPAASAAPAPAPAATPAAPPAAPAEAPRLSPVPLEAWLPNRLPGSAVVRVLTVNDARVFTALWQAHKARAVGTHDLHLLAAAETLIDAVQRLPAGTLRAAEITWRDAGWVVWVDGTRPAVVALTPDPGIHLAGL